METKIIRHINRDTEEEIQFHITEDGQVDILIMDGTGPIATAKIGDKSAAMIASAILMTKAKDTLHFLLNDGIRNGETTEDN